MILIGLFMLAPVVFGVKRGNFEVTCDGNFKIEPPEGPIASA